MFRQAHKTQTGATSRSDRLRQRVARLVREPLVHFLIAGGLLFGIYAWLNPGTDGRVSSAARTVHITANEVEWLKQAWARQWQPPPGELVSARVRLLDLRREWPPFDSITVTGA